MPPLPVVPVATTPLATRLVSLLHHQFADLGNADPAFDLDPLTRLPSPIAFRDRGAGSDRNRGKTTDEPARGGPRGGYGARARGGS